MKKLIVVTCCFVFGIANNFAQDIHFTMYDAVPVLSNPSTAGVFNGDFRGVVNYRNQWANIGSAYNTFSLSLDGGAFKKKWRKGYLGLGLGAFRDVAGDTKMGTTNINLSLSSIVYLSDKTSAAVGVTSSWNQNSMNPDELRWDSQFNGQNYDASASSNESFGFENKSYFDFSVGGLWAYGKGTKTLSSHDAFNTKLGLAFYHVTQPNRQINFGEVDKLYSKWAFHTESHIGLSNSGLALIPKTIVYFQGPTREITVGLLGRYMLVEESKYTGLFQEMAVSVGAYYRVGDAFVPSVEFEIANYAIGVSYDINISGLARASGGNGGPEIFLRFINPNPFAYGKGTKSSARFR